MLPATIQTYLRPHVVSDISQILIFAIDLMKDSSIKFHENPSSSNGADTYGRTNMWKPISAFRDLRERVFPKFEQAVEGGYSAIRYQARTTIYGVFTNGKAR